MAPTTNLTLRQTLQTGHRALKDHITALQQMARDSGLDFEAVLQQAVAVEILWTVVERTLRQEGRLC